MPLLPFFSYRNLALLICFSDVILCLQAKFCLSLVQTQRGGRIPHPLLGILN